MKCNCSSVNTICSVCINNAFPDINITYVCPKCQYPLSNICHLLNFIKKGSLVNQDQNSKQKILSIYNNIEVNYYPRIEKQNFIDKEKNLNPQKIKKMEENAEIGCKHSYLKEFVPIGFDCCKDIKLTCVQCYFKKRSSFEKCFFCNKEINPEISKYLKMLWDIIIYPEQKILEKKLIDHPRYIKCQVCGIENICFSANCCKKLMEPFCFNCFRKKLIDKKLQNELKDDEIICPFCKYVFGKLINLHQLIYPNQEENSLTDELSCNFCIRKVKAINSVRDINLTCCNSVKIYCINCYVRKYKIFHKCVFCQKKFDEATSSKLLEIYKILEKSYIQDKMCKNQTNFIPSKEKMRKK